jgi:hypothetical protein
MDLIVVISAINAAPLDTAHRFNVQTSRWAPKPSGCRTQHQCYRMQIIVINAVLLDTDQGPSSVYSAGSISSPPCAPALRACPKHLGIGGHYSGDSFRRGPTITARPPRWVLSLRDKNAAPSVLSSRFAGRTSLSSLPRWAQIKAILRDAAQSNHRYQSHSAGRSQKPFASLPPRLIQSRNLKHPPVLYQPPPRLSRLDIRAAQTSTGVFFFDSDIRISNRPFIGV